MKSSHVVSALLISLGALPAHASLTSYSSNGINLVYDDMANITWLADANLLDTLFDSQGRSHVINAIKSAMPSVTDATGNPYAIANKDFHPGISGAATWYGAKAFIGYLNSINYAGSSQWSLPSAGSNPASGFNQTGSQFGQLFYNTLGGSAGSSIPDTDFFTGQTNASGDDSGDDSSDDYSDESTSRNYWLNTELNSALAKAWQFDVSNGYQDTDAKKDRKSFIWAITTGNLITVPLPGAAWLLLSGMLGFLGIKRISKTAS